MTNDGGTCSARASLAPRPRSADSHWLSNMGAILLPNGYNLSMPAGNYLVYPMGNTTLAMQTVGETRRARLEELIQAHGGLIANLNEALGYERNDTRLARIRNANSRSDRPGKIFQMGDAQAREIEDRLALERGWMDTPPGYETITSEDLRELTRVAQELAPYQVKQLVAIGMTLISPPAAADSQMETNSPQTPQHGSEGSKGLTSVKPVIPQKIGEGHLGPAAERNRGAKSGRGSKTQPGVRDGHAQRRR